MSEIKNEVPNTENQPFFRENALKKYPELNELQATELTYVKDVSNLLLSMYECGADPNYIFQGTSLGLTPLALACRADNSEAVRLLLNKGADPNFKLAIFYIRSVEVAKVMVEFGANLKAKGWYGNTLLHSVCSWNNLPLAQYYISQGLNAGEKNDFGQTPTHYAFTRLISVPKNNPLQPVTNLPPKQEPLKLLARMATRNQIAQRPKLPKMDSGTLRELSYPLILLFIANGGNSSVVDELGFTPWDYAKASGWESTLNKLYKGLKYDDDELFQSLRSGDAKPLIEHLDDGKSPDITDRCETLVHVAANNGDCTALSALIKNHAKIDLRLTPPEYNHDCLFGSTPLFSVCNLMNSPQRLQAMQMLITAGADVNTPCIGFQTPFLLLCQDGRTRAIRVMIHHAYEQLISAKIFADKPTINTKFNHNFNTTAHASKDEIGNAALKTLCEMFIADENLLEKYLGEEEKVLARYQQAQNIRNEALTTFERELVNFSAGESSAKTLDSALEHYLINSNLCRAARHEQLNANDIICQQLTFQQSQEYKTSHKQLGAIIRRMVLHVELNPKVRALIDSNASLQRTCATENLTQPDTSPLLKHN